MIWPEIVLNQTVGDWPIALPASVMIEGLTSFSVMAVSLQADKSSACRKNLEPTCPSSCFERLREGRHFEGRNGKTRNPVSRLPN